MTTTLRKQAPRTQIGRSQPRRDAREKLRGQAQFVGDILELAVTETRRDPVMKG